MANGYFINDVVSQMTVAGASRMSWGLDPLHRVRSVVRESWVSGAWANASSTEYHFDADGDEPSWVWEETSDPFAVSRYVEDPTGALAVTTGSRTTGGATLSMLDVQGSVMGTVPLINPIGGTGNTTTSPGVAPSWSLDVPGLRLQAYTEFGAALDLTTGRSVVSPGTSGAKRAARYGWLGGAQRSVDALAGVVLMGVRVYDPSLGRFWQRDPIPGGNATTYDYCSGDPVNCVDLDGQWSIKGVLKAVAVVGEVAAFIPGPIGAAAGAISAGAYLATGNKAKAAEMALVAAANLVGAGAAVKVGLAAVKVGVKAGRAGGMTARAGAKATRAIRGSGKKPGCNSFAAGTPILLADGTFLPIEDIHTGDLLVTTDPVTGVDAVNPVLGTITGTGTRHLITLELVDQATGDTSTLTVTGGHPLWATSAADTPIPSEGTVIGQAETTTGWAAQTANWFTPPATGPPATSEPFTGGWVQVGNLTVGDTLTTTQGSVTITNVADRGWATGQTVYNLHLATTHTYHAGTAEVLTHNCPGVNWGQQEKHFRGHGNFKTGAGELTADPRVLARGAGTGTQVGGRTVGRPGSKERVVYSHRIGTHVSKQGVRKATNVGIVHYGKRGVHIVPGRPM